MLLGLPFEVDVLFLHSQPLQNKQCFRSQYMQQSERLVNVAVTSALKNRDPFGESMKPGTKMARSIGQTSLIGDCDVQLMEHSELTSG
jgi:hypothetical protein